LLCVRGDLYDADFSRSRGPPAVVKPSHRTADKSESARRELDPQTPHSQHLRVYIFSISNSSIGIIELRVALSFSSRLCMYIYCALRFPVRHLRRQLHTGTNLGKIMTSRNNRKSSSSSSSSPSPSPSPPPQLPSISSAPHPSLNAAAYPKPRPPLLLACWSLSA
jgi:hypothetical protein